MVTEPKSSSPSANAVIQIFTAIVRIVEFLAIIVNWLPRAHTHTVILCVVNFAIIAGISDYHVSICVCMCVWLLQNLVNFISTSNFIGISRVCMQFCAFSLDCAFEFIYLPFQWEIYIIKWILFWIINSIEFTSVNKLPWWNWSNENFNIIQTHGEGQSFPIMTND